MKNLTPFLVVGGAVALITLLGKKELPAGWRAMDRGHTRFIDSETGHIWTTPVMLVSAPSGERLLFFAVPEGNTVGWANMQVLAKGVHAFAEGRARPLDNALVLDETIEGFRVGAVPVLVDTLPEAAAAVAEMTESSTAQMIEVP